MSARCRTHTVCGGGGSIFFCSWGRCPQTPALPGAWPAAPSAPARPGGGAARRLTSRVAYWGIAVGGDPPSPPPLLRPASPMRFVIFLLGLQRRQLAPDLPNAQFTLSATKPMELVSVRTLYNSHGLWGEVLSALFGALPPKPRPAGSLACGTVRSARRRRRGAQRHLARGGRGGKILKRIPFRFLISRRGSWDLGRTHTQTSLYHPSPCTSAPISRITPPHPYLFFEDTPSGGPRRGASQGRHPQQIHPGMCNNLIIF